MTWVEHHQRSESLASAATAASKAGDHGRAIDLYREAAVEEASALGLVGAGKKRTLSVTAVSAVALYCKGEEYIEAEKLAYRCLGDFDLAPFAQSELQELLQDIWSERARRSSTVSFVPGDVLVSVKGGEVLHGGAPLELIVNKVNQVEKLLYRVAEFLLDRPHRRSGEPDREIRSMVRPWLIQAPPSSYQFAVRVQEPPQQDLFAEHRPQIEQVSKTFLDLVRASAANPDVLESMVPDDEYRNTFLKMTRNLAPTGKSFETIAFRGSDRPASQAVALSSGARTEINAHIRARRAPEMPDAVFERVTGVLRAVHLDEQWMEITTETPPERHVRIRRTSEALDDIIGPMVNHRVTVEAIRRGNTLVFQDIQLDE